jgi:hypothetical protein
MFVDSHADNLTSAVRYALETTRARVVCPFHADVTIRAGDDAAETQACNGASSWRTHLQTDAADCFKSGSNGGLDFI